MRAHETRLILVLLLIPFEGIATAQITGDLEVLREIAAANEANLERIVTWRGRALVKDRSEMRNGTSTTLQLQESTIDFVYDRLSDQLLSVKQMTVSKVVDGEPEPPQHYVEGSIRTRDRFFRTLYRKDADKRRLIITERTPREDRRLDFGGNYFDPFVFLEKDGYPLRQELLAWFEIKQSGSFDGLLAISRSGSEITLKKDNRQGTTSVSRFDMAQGGNLVEYSVQFRLHHHDRDVSRKYINQDGIWLPAEASKMVLRHKESNRKDDHSILFVEQAVNQTLPTDAFAPEKLGIRQGDEVIDRTTGVSYFFQGSPEAAAVAARASALFWVLVLTAGLLVVLLVGWRLRGRLAWRTA